MLNYAIGKKLWLSEHSYIMVQISIMFKSLLVIHQTAYSSYVVIPSHIIYTIQIAFSLLANRCRRLWVRILHSAEEDNLYPFDSNITCLCQSIQINNNKYVYRQSQVRKPTGSEVEWAECLLIMGTGCRVQVFSLILDSSVGLSAGIQSAGE